MQAYTSFEFLDATKSENEEGTYLPRFKVLKRGSAVLSPTYDGKVIKDDFYVILFVNSKPVKENTKFYVAKDSYAETDSVHLNIGLRDKMVMTL